VVHATKTRPKAAACCDDNADGDNIGNDGADAAGIHMKLTFLALITTVAMMGLMQPV
jgi:hypothetical protein